MTNISAGDTVHWVWVGSSSHTTTSDVAGWDSGSHGNGFTFDHTFNTAGSFMYHCVNHPTEMLGEIRVVASVGGVAELPSVSAAPAASAKSSGGHSGIVAGVVAETALAVAVGGGALYARERRGE